MTSDRPIPHLGFLCLQPTVEGQGSHAHVWGIVGGLRRRGWTVAVHQPAAAVSTKGLARRIVPLIATQLAFVRSTGRADAWYVRMHPAAVLALSYNAARGLFGRRHRVVVEVNGPSEDWVTAWPVLGRVRWLLNWLLRRVFYGADAAVVVTEGLGAWVQTMSGRADLEVVTIPNGVDITAFHPYATGGPAGLPAHYAVFVGELASWQGLEDVLGAFEHHDWPGDLDLVIAGDGVMAARVQAAAASPPRKGGRRVIALGRVPHAQVPGLLTGSAVALVPSRDRAGTGVAPLKLFEALACGVPVVAADIADTRHYTAGPLVACGDVAGWAAAVLRAVAGGSDPTGLATAHSWDARAELTDAVLRG